VLALFIPHKNPIALGGLLVLTMAPLAFASALSPRFKVAPFTGALVLLIAGQLGEGPIHAAAYRLLEVILGGGIALVVSFLVLPEHAHELGLKTGARILNQLAGALPKLLTGYMQQLDVNESLRLQSEIGQHIADFQVQAASSRGERLIGLVPRPDPEVLLRNLLRLRNDFMMIARAAVAPLPATIAGRLAPSIERIAADAGTCLEESAKALVSHSSASPPDAFKSARGAFTSELTAFRSEGGMRSLSISDLERTFALSLALEQLEQHLIDLQRCVEEFSHERK